MFIVVFWDFGIQSKKRYVTPLQQLPLQKKTLQHSHFHSPSW